jgi:hypothetical protein
MKLEATTFDNYTKDFDLTLSSSIPELTLIRMERDAVIAHIEVWAAELRACTQPELQVIAEELSSLKKLLSNSHLNKRATGKVLLTLGELTTLTASFADRAIASRLENLGSWLMKVGREMA